MKKLLIAATLAAAAVAATPLLAQQTGDKPAGTAATETCPMAGEHGTRAERHAQMQARMAAMHAQAGERHGGGGRGEHRGQHQNRGEGCPLQQAPTS